MIVDTAGLRKKAKVNEDLEFYSVLRSIRAIENSDVCILMIDATSGIEAQDMAIFNLIIRNKKGCVIVVNKWDLVPNKTSNTMKEYKAAIEKRIAPTSDIPIVFTSATNKQRIMDVLEAAEHVFANYSRRIPAAGLEGQVHQDQVHHPAPHAFAEFRVLLQPAAVHPRSLQAFPGKQAPQPLRLYGLHPAGFCAAEIKKRLAAGQPF